METSRANATELLRAGKVREIWSRYCGHLDLDIAGFMRIQEELLREQIVRLGRSEIGRAVMGCVPDSVEEFRAKVPLTTYRDYAPYLLAKREDVLPEKPVAWVHTSGRSGEYDFKWIPYPRRLYELGGENAFSTFLLSASRRRGEVRLREGMSFLYTIAPPPYISGLFTDSMLEQFAFRVFPPVEEAKRMDYPTRVQEAFRLALSEGLDFFYGVTSILLRISEQFSQGRSGGGGGPKLNGRAILRLAGAALKAALRGHKIQPRDIWSVKGAICGGMDTSIFKDKVAASWGVEPTEAYGSTEYGIVASQSWARRGLCFYPNNNYWEFVEESDYRHSREDSGHRPTILRMDEITPDREYVLVGTSFHGGTLVRYVVGDMLRVSALEDRDAGIRLPQFTFVARIDDLIDLGGFTRLTETTVWRAIEASGVRYADWTVRKEYDNDTLVLNLYLEPREEMDPLRAAERIGNALKELDAPYRELETITGLRPLRVTPLSQGTFRRYFEERQAAGADLAHLKPPHMNAKDEMIASLMRMSAWKLRV